MNFRGLVVVGQRDHGHRGHGAVRHGLYGGQPASSFQNAVTVLLLDIRCSPDHTYRLIVHLYTYRLNRNGWVVLLLEKGGSRAFFSERR